MSLTGQVPRIHDELYKRTDGRLGHRVIGVPTLLVAPPVVAQRQRGPTHWFMPADGDDCLLVASSGGADRPPAWFHNLSAHPDVEIHVWRERRRGTTRIIEPSDPSYERLRRLVNENTRPLHRLLEADEQAKYLSSQSRLPDPLPDDRSRLLCRRGDVAQSRSRSCP